MRIQAISLALLMMVLGFGNSVWAQDSKIETGIVAFQAGDFKKAIDALKVGLANTAEVKPKNLPRGYYHLGMASFQLMQQTAQAAQQEGNLEAKAMEISNLLDQAYTSMIEARKTDIEGKWSDKVNKTLNALYFSFVNGSVVGLNQLSVREPGDEVEIEIKEVDEKGNVTERTYKITIYESKRREGLVQIIKATSRAIEIDAAGYMPYDLRGQAYLAKKDTASAYADFKSAVTKFDAKAPERPDIFVAYTFWRMAVIERFHLKNQDLSLATLEKGKSMLEKEYARIQTMKDKYKPEELTKLQSQYQSAMQDLGNFELDILLNAPDKLRDALAKFDAATAKEPNNYIVHVAYAQLLEKVDTVKALSMYEKATKIDGKNYLAFFNLGALYVNLGVAKYKSANAVEKNMELANSLQKQGNDYFRLAFPVLTKALELKPCDSEILKAILDIAIRLSGSDEAMMAEYTKYKKVKSECGG